ncbi:DUF1811 family protein [Exiguobacterium sp. ZWU0009]|uniref:DUF1811 family protein n=1 Tax=Exiguobacterium sp. ZWU0009 TaxID=1224749 RepID=UPI000648DAF4|nr:DUF1811 family protein [Exiguobacterium sp. ZWU0009]
METRMSQLSKYELEMLITKLSEQKRKAEQHGNVSEVEVVTRKIAIAKSYLIDPARFERGAFYRIEGEEARFELHFVNGVMGWGHFEGTAQEVAIPIALFTGEGEQT